MPNIDDIGKLFESVPGIVSVPNPGLSSEYAWNFELGIVKDIVNKMRIEVNGFYTLLTNAIVRRPFTFNGADSLNFNGIYSGVEALQNLAKATVYGLQVSASYSFTNALSLQSHANWISGKETDDIKNERVPLRHALPFYGSSAIRYQVKKVFFEATTFYNSRIENKDFAPSEKAKTDIYAKDANGKPWSPGWYTINLKASFNVTKNFQLTAGWENITNMRYRPYSSGIVAPGSNFIISARANW